MTQPVMYGQPSFSQVYIPSLPSLSLSEAEQNLISRLQMRAWRFRGDMELRNAYYEGEQVITNLNISIPSELSLLRTIIGWGAIPIDPINDRLNLQSFRLSGATDSDQDLYDLWVGNSMDAEQSLAHVDALVMGHAYGIAGSPAEAGGLPALGVESPLNMVCDWDVRSRKPKVALQSFWLNSRRCAALHLPDQTIQLAEDDNGQWEIVDRDQHNFGLVPVVRLANRARSNNRDGASEITLALMSIIDGACRTLLGLEVAREFYSVPQKYILGATEADFQNADGTRKTVWATYISHVLGLERDENDNVPEVGQFTSMDPSVFTKIIDMYGAQAASVTGATPQDLGLYTQGNPPSADSVKFVEARRDRKSVRMQAQFGRSWVELEQLGVRFMNKGSLPAKFERMEADWADPSTPSPSAVSDAITKQIAVGAIPATSDVTLKRLGYSPVERARLEQDRLVEQAQRFLDSVTNPKPNDQAVLDQTGPVSGDQPVIG